MNISRSCKPSIEIEIDNVKYDDKEIFIIEVQKGNNPPYSHRGVCYKRMGGTSQPLEPFEIAKMTLESQGRSFDVLPAKNSRVATTDDIDEMKVFEYIKISQEKRKLVAPGTSIKQILLNLELIPDREIQPCNAAIMMFGKEPKKFVPQSSMNMIRFPGTTISSEIIDRATAEGDIPSIIQVANLFIQRNIRTASKIEGFVRIDVSEYPIEALREAVINTVAHRDYLPIASSYLYIFSDRIEIGNPGGFPYKGVTADQLIKNGGGVTIRRNPKIAELLHNMGLMEKAGTGISKIKESTKSHGLPEPLFNITPDWFRITITGPGEKILDVVKGGYIVTDLSSLNERQIGAVKYLHESRGYLTNSIYRAMFNVIDVTAFRDLSELVKKGFVRRIGERRVVRYVLI